MQLSVLTEETTMKVITKYTVEDETKVFEETNTREQARDVLRSLKAKGNKNAKIYREEYALIEVQQVR
ncbi:MAG: hypothetical protein [Myoviridae sp. ctThM1]|nr:MAG: hypothetical protein [Myoviridae sp. ctThM1]